jgi:hypothetical protein
MQGDELAILLFWFTLFATFVLEAVKAETTKRRIFFGALALLFLLIALLWHQVSGLWPALTAQVAAVATNPVTWFALFMFIAAIFAFHRPKQTTLSGAGTAPADLLDRVSNIEAAVRAVSDSFLDHAATAAAAASAQPLTDKLFDQLKETADLYERVERIESQLRPTSAVTEKLRQLDRTAFLLSVAATDALYLQKLEAALVHLPAPRNDIDTDAKMKHETGRLNEYISDVGANLNGSRWADDFHSAMQRAQVEADSDLLRMDTPEGLHPHFYRLFHIASMCRDHAQGFLQRSIVKANDQAQHMLQMLRDRPAIHKYPKD